MKTVALAFQYLWSRPLAAMLNLLLLSLGLASFSFVLQVSEQMEHAFERDLAGIDLVVGAKGSPLQLILTGVFHLDAPSGNVALVDVQALAKHPQVGQLIPMSLGDSFQGYRIVGSTPDYPAHYGASFAQGRAWASAMEVVLGAQVARSLQLAPGAEFAGSHGLAAGGAGHADKPFTVVGVLQPCACVLDRLVLTSLESVWDVHGKHGPAETEHDADHAKSQAGVQAKDDREVTLALIRYKSPMAAVSFPRLVNTSTRMQAAAPALEITRLLRMLGVGADVLRGFAAVLLLTASLSVFIALWNAVRERQADLAMLRMLGAPAPRGAGLVLAEALWLGLLACLLGLLLGHGLTALVSHWLVAEKSLALNPWQWASAEVYVPMLGLGVAVLAALLPVVQAYRVDVFQLLNRG